MLREKEAKTSGDASIADLRSELNTKNDEIEKMKSELEQLNLLIGQASKNLLKLYLIL